MPDEQPKPPQRSVNWTGIAAAIAILGTTYNMVSPAAASFESSRSDKQSMQETLRQIVEHQKKQDERMDRFDLQVSDLNRSISNIDRQTAVTATSVDKMWKWIDKSGSNK